VVLVSAGRRPVSREEALRRVGDREAIHTFITGSGMAIGADWPRALVIEAIDTYGVADSGPHMAAMGHTLVLIDDRGPVFLEAHPPGQACRECGCTDEDGCPEGCWWAEEGLCSACADGHRPAAEAAPPMTPREGA